MINTADLLDAFDHVTVTVRTYGAATVNVYGEPERTPTDTIRSVVAHPSGRKTLEQLPESERGRSTWSFYSADAFAIGDRIQHAGDWYRVVAVGDWSHLAGIYLAHAALEDSTA